MYNKADKSNVAVRFLRHLGEFFQNDATKQFDYRTLLGIYFAVLFWRLVDKVSVQNLDSLAYTIGALQALNTIGLSTELITYFRAITGGYRQADTYMQADSATVTGETVQVNATHVDEPESSTFSK